MHIYTANFDLQCYFVKFDEYFKFAIYQYCYIPFNKYHFFFFTINPQKSAVDILHAKSRNLI